MSSTHIIAIDRTVVIERKVHVIECAACSTNFGIGADFMARRKEDHGTFYCPNGHRNYYSGDNTEEKLRKQLERAEQQKRWAREDANRQREARLKAERQRAAAKGQVTKMRNRIANGVCPVGGCTRSFQNVHAHIRSQHPDFVAEHPEVIGR